MRAVSVLAFNALDRAGQELWLSNAPRWTINKIRDLLEKLL